MKAPWEDVHRMFYEACLCGGVDEKKAKILYYAVHHFGPRWQTVTETRLEMVEDGDGQMVPQEVTEQRRVRIDPPPPTLEEVEQVESLIEEENPELTVIRKTNREVLRRRPRRGSDRANTGDGSGRPSSPRVGPTVQKRPSFAMEHSEDGGRRAGDVEQRGARDGERMRDDDGRDRRAGPAGRPPAKQPAGPALPPVTPEEQQWAEQQVRRHIEQQTGQQRAAEYEVERTENGFRVFVQYLRLDEDGRPTNDIGGSSRIRLSDDGQVLEMISGM